MKGRRTDEVYKANVCYYKGDDDVASYTCYWHWEEPDHCQDRAQMEIFLVVQLHRNQRGTQGEDMPLKASLETHLSPERKSAKATPLNESDDEYYGDLAIRPSPN